MRGWRCGLAAGSALAVVVALASPRADATFPGRNGVLAWSYNIGIPDPQDYHFVDTEVGILTVSAAGGPDHSLVSCSDPLGAMPPPYSGLCPEPRDISYSPRGDKLAWDVPTGSGTYQFQVMVGDSRAGSIRAVGSDDFDPSFAPDGRQLVFVRGHGRLAQIVTSDLQGSKIRVLAQVTGADPGNGQDPAPKFSPSGKQIMFVSKGGIWLTSADGRRARRIIASGFAPDWAPNGKQITYISSQDNRVYVAAASGASRRKLLTRSVCEYSNYVEVPCAGSAFAQFSPNGKQIAFSDADTEGNLHLYTIPGRGGRAHQIDHRAADYRGTVTGMSWQPVR
jgi:Tol biopolymer transport system component